MLRLTGCFPLQTEEEVGWKKGNIAAANYTFGLQFINIFNNIQGPAEAFVRFEVLTAVTIKNTVFWDVTTCGSCKNRVSEEFIASIIRMTRIDKLGATLAVLPTEARCEAYYSFLQRASVATYY
jgi:hypothetical protein